MKEFTRVMKALADPGRVKIMKLLQARPLCVCELQSLLGLAQPTVSKHLRVLEDVGLIAGRRKGLWVMYAPAEGGSRYAEEMRMHLESWLEDDPEIVVLRERAEKVDKRELCARPENKQKIGETA